MKDLAGWTSRLVNQPAVEIIMVDKDTQWFFLRNERQFGPFDYQQLQQLAESGGIVASDRIKNGGSEHWAAATDVPGLTIAEAPIASRPNGASLPPSFAPHIEPDSTRRRLDRIASSQRRLVFAALALLLADVASAFGYLRIDSVGALAIWALLGPFVGMLAGSLGLSALPYGILGAIPICNLFMLAKINRRATDELRASGYWVGLFGAERPTTWAGPARTANANQQPSFASRGSNERCGRSWVLCCLPWFVTDAWSCLRKRTAENQFR